MEQHYRVGDEIICEFNLASSDEPWVQERKVQILGFEPENEFGPERMLCYIPQYITINKSFVLNVRHQRNFGFHNKFLGEQAVYVSRRQVTKHLPAMPGETCDKCGLHVQYAQGDGGTYLCRACRENPYR